MHASGTQSVLAGRYLLGREIGRGGLAIVYQAWDTVLHRRVAVKLMRDLLIDPAGRERFEREGQTLAKLSHPGLVGIFDAGVLDERPFLVLELINGDTLAARRRNGPMPMSTVLDVGAELADVLAYIHGLGITHRDVKPGNVLIDDDNRVRLADFGLARSADTTHHTAPGFTMGTAAYMSPEQVRGDEPGKPSDIYALGLILIEALLGTTVYNGSPEAAALARLVTSPVSQLRLAGPMRDLLASMTADLPERRPSAEQVLAQLRVMPGLLLAGSGETDPVTQPMRLGRRVAAPRLVFGTALALIVAPLLVAGQILGGGEIPASQADLAGAPSVMNSPQPLVSQPAPHRAPVGVPVRQSISGSAGTAHAIAANAAETKRGGQQATAQKPKKGKAEAESKPKPKREAKRKG